jgi:hypothetical protein
MMKFVVLLFFNILITRGTAQKSPQIENPFKSVILKDDIYFNMRLFQNFSFWNSLSGFI